MPLGCSGLFHFRVTFVNDGSAVKLKGSLGTENNNNPFNNNYLFD